MTVSIVELTNDLRPFERDPSYNPNVFSESDDDLPGTSTHLSFCVLWKVLLLANLSVDNANGYFFWNTHFSH